MRIKALTTRILTQVTHDKRTIALILIAPLVILSLVYFILNSESSSYNLGIVAAPGAYIEELTHNDDLDIKLTYLKSEDIPNAIKNKEILAAIDMNPSMTEAKIYLDGTNSLDAEKVQALVKSSALKVLQNNMKQNAEDTKEKLSTLLDSLTQLKTKMPQVKLQVPEIDLSELNMTEPNFTTDYIYGEEDTSFFDNFGAGLIGIIIFFVVFLIAGINFLTERTSGTLEKLLSTPIKRSEIIIGYVFGFSLLALLQTLLITFFVIYVLGLKVVGSIWYVLLINLLTAITALTLGILLSSLANNEFQMVQFIPIVILPQVFLCGLFNLSNGWEIVGLLMPLHYTTNALTEVMLKGSGFERIWLDCLILLGCSLIFMFLNIQLLKRQRSL